MSLVKYNNNSISAVTTTSLASGNLVPISEQTASGSASIEFTTGIDSTYPIYRFEFINIHASTTTPSFTFNMSTDNGSNYNVVKTTTFFRAIHNEAGADGQVSYDAGEHLAQSTSDQKIIQYIGDGNDESGSGEMYLFNPSSSVFVKHFLSTTNKTSVTYNGTNYVGGYGNTTSPVNSIIFRMTAGNIDAGTIKLYGIKDS